MFDNFLMLIKSIYKGMTFAMIEIKLAMAKLLRTYTISAGANGTHNLELDESFLIRKPKHGISVILNKRIN